MAVALGIVVSVLSLPWTLAGPMRSREKLPAVRLSRLFVLLKPHWEYQNLGPLRLTDALGAFSGSSLARRATDFPSRVALLVVGVLAESSCRQ